MVDQESGCFICSKWFIVIISVIYVLFGGFLILGAVGIAINPENKPDYTAELAIQAFVSGVFFICAGIVGLFGAIKMNYCFMLSFAITVSIGLCLTIMMNLAMVAKNGATLLVAPGLLLLIPTVICSWVVVSGLRS